GGRRDRRRAGGADRGARRQAVLPGGRRSPEPGEERDRDGAGRRDVGAAAGAAFQCHLARRERARPNRREHYVHARHGEPVLLEKAAVVVGRSTKLWTGRLLRT